MLNENQEILNYFLKKTNQKATNKVYMGYMSNVKSLIETGYTKQQIESVIDYLVDHPPRNGFHSMGFIQYVIEETLAKIKVKQYENTQSFFEATTEAENDSSNANKYISNKPNPLIKGGVKF